jgi:hypothetical protein
MNRASKEGTQVAPGIIESFNSHATRWLGVWIDSHLCQTPLTLGLTSLLKDGLYGNKLKYIYYQLKSSYPEARDVLGLNY